MSPKKYRTHQSIGFIGLGMMGSRMIGHLKGYAKELLIMDVDTVRAQEAATRANGRSVSSVNEMANADIVVLMLPNSKVVDSVVRGEQGKPGLIDLLSTGAMIIDMSSSTPSNTIENAALAAQKGLLYMDAPVSGGPTGAESGKLAIMAGGTEEDFLHAKPLLDRMGTNVILAGAVGSGHAVKALNNLLSATVLAATSEVFAAGEKFGLDPEVMQKIINASSGGSFATSHTWPKAILPKSYDFGFALALMHKDVGIGMSLIESTGIKTTLVNASAKMWDRALKASQPGADMTEITRQIQKEAGL
ncbi:NAD(P)-dependent oxidoreductase [Zwartia panacis]|uniref:NAD(P)-dependent oxidoreductase n=1 Tax=Zwartia panacis TaxID=2683345 RepID=UPI0025B2927C|nr:NAD(P)-dependent oxidoreductase [Zwartia panacis]MDN4016415.1 NAD(P)-dependent oxidoreductase [Zwartia panacis]